MRYPHFAQLDDLVARKIVTRRPHPSLPIDIYNYTVAATFTPISEWTEAMKDCRGLILDRQGDIVGRPFRKFWNYEQVLSDIPSEPFEVWEKMDGSLGIVCSYASECVVATRGSFESDQAKWFAAWIGRKHKDFLPSDVTYLFEVLYPENRIVVDYGNRAEAVLLTVMSKDGVDLSMLFDHCDRFSKPRRFDGLKDFSQINSDPQFAGQEGFVVRWQSGFRAKLKLADYCRLHRLITQCSTRTIWEMMKSGADTQELIDRVPAEFAEWVNAQISALNEARLNIEDYAQRMFDAAPRGACRKEFAEYAKTTKYPGLLFSLLDGKNVSEAVWKLVEPAWSTPFRRDIDA